jgi:hypothetical protein
MNRKVGRPKAFGTPKDLVKVLNEYFSTTKEEEITITGLCIALRINKDTFYEYMKKDKYKDIINEARMLVENSYELSLRKYGRSGDIFALKNFGWKDKQELEQTTRKIEIKDDLPDEVE